MSRIMSVIYIKNKVSYAYRDYNWNSCWCKRWVGAFCNNFFNEKEDKLSI